jgi:hypothetical protein
MMGEYYKDGSWRDRKASIDWIGLDQDRDEWRALVITVMNLRVS